MDIFAYGQEQLTSWMGIIRIVIHLKEYYKEKKEGMSLRIKLINLIMKA
jgi:hypothetical protein